MPRAKRSPRLLLALVIICLALAAPAVMGQAFDSAHTRVGFELSTRWGQRLVGRFPRYEGEVRTLPDGRQQVTVRLATADVEIVGYPRYTEFSRGPRFFDAKRHPWVSFTSDPYPPSLLSQGGALTGVLRIHGVSQHETFTVEPAACAWPAVGCDLVARGSVRRDDYGMDDWKWAVRPRVRFELRLRLLQEQGPGPAP
jgi:polyisoprenoid-binding protein YceI